MIQLKNKVNKSALLRELKAEANEIYKESWQPEYTIKVFMYGVEALFKLLQLPDDVSDNDSGVQQPNVDNTTTPPNTNR